jgi:hypothetical protein
VISWCQSICCQTLRSNYSACTATDRYTIPGWSKPIYENLRFSVHSKSRVALVVELYELNSVHQQLASDLVSTIEPITNSLQGTNRYQAFAFKFNLYRYVVGPNGCGKSTLLGLLTGEGGGGEGGAQRVRCPLAKQTQGGTQPVHTMRYNSCMTPPPSDCLRMVHYAL